MVHQKYHIDQKLYSGASKDIYRVRRIADDTRMIITLLKDKDEGNLVSDFTYYSDLVQDEGMSSIILKPLFVDIESKIIAYEDFEAISFAEYLNEETVALNSFIYLAIQLAEVLKCWHENELLIIQDMPENFLIQKRTFSIKFIPVDVLPARRGSIQKTGIYPPSSIPFLSPELTGKVNLPVDSRSDLYALGVVLYKLLTGHLPFQAQNHSELVYAKITKMPVHPLKHRSEISPIIAQIVLKLLAKEPKNRYQSAKGLLSDLEQCDFHKQSIQNLSFEPGLKDHSAFFELSGKLYGRDAHVNALGVSFEKVRQTKRKLLIIGGVAGSGKSELVMNYFNHQSLDDLVFIEGKFEQFQDEIPYDAFRKAFDAFCTQILSKNETDFSFWKEKIVQSTGINGKALTDIIPSLEKITGTQKPLPELTPYEERKRLFNVFCSFLGAVSGADHPMVLFLDDWQWADRGSVELLNVILNCKDINHLLVIAAFRSNEVDSNHPFYQSFIDGEPNAFIREKFIINELSEQEVYELLADSFKMNKVDLQILKKNTYLKTNGNPFFTKAYLTSLFEDGIIFFDYDDYVWKIKYQELGKQDVQPSVAGFLSSRIFRLKPEIRAVLELASCIGNRFDIDTIQIISGLSTETLDQYFLSAMADSFVDFTDENKRHLKFVHDTVQQSVYESISYEYKKELHVKTARSLLKSFSRYDFENRLFEIVNHYNTGYNDAFHQDEKLVLLELNIKAAKKAKDEQAYQVAARYINFAWYTLIGSDKFEQMWNNHYNLVLDLYRAKAQIEYLNNNFETSEMVIQQGVAMSKTVVDKAELYYLLIVQYTLEARYTDAIKNGSKALKLFGIELPENNYVDARDAELEFINNFLNENGAEGFLKLPQMSLDEHRTIIKLIITMGPPCYRSHQYLWAVLVTKAINLTIQFGTSPQIGYIFTAFGGLVGWVSGDYNLTKSMGEVARKIMLRFSGFPSELSVFFLMTGSSVTHWIKHYKYATRDYEEAYKIGINSGNLQYTAYAYGHNMYTLFFQGINLQELQSKIADYLDFSIERKNKWAIDLLHGGNYVLEILTDNMDPDSEKSRYLLEEYLDTCESNRNIQVLCIFSILKTYMHLLTNNYIQAEVEFEKAEQIIFAVGTQGLLPWPEHVFNKFLLLLARSEHQNSNHSDEILNQLRELEYQFEIWAQSAQENYAHKLYLVQAEIFRINRDVLKAWEYYDAAIDAAIAGDFIQHQALISERCGKFLLEVNKPRAARTYLYEAWTHYSKWGAVRKVKLLEQEYIELFGSLLNNFSNAGQVFNQNLLNYDIHDFYEFSKELSTEMHIDKLSVKMIEAAEKIAGADRCVLLLRLSNMFVVEAEGSSDKEQVITHSNIPLDEYRDIPHQIIHYVNRSAQKILLNDMLGSHQFKTDNYIQCVNPKSIICLPLLQNNQIRGILYLENRLLSNSFSDTSIQLLELLSTQMAISIDNAFVYRNLEQMVSVRTTELEKSKKELEISNQTKDKFFSIIAHDLKSPMSTLLGLTELLLNNFDNEDNTRKRMFLSHIVDTARNTYHLLEDLLTWSRSQSIKLEITPCEIYADELCAEVQKILKQTAEKKGVKLISKVPKDISVFADRESTQTILRNLISNAIKFSPKEEEVLISAHKIENKEGAYVRFEITDFGMGIEAKKISSLFEINKNKSTPGTDNEKGTGLGLVLCKEFTEINNGKIGVNSIPGKKTVFWVDLPAYQSLEITELTQKDSRDVLIVDDEPVNYLLVDTLIKKLDRDIHVVHALNGEDAIKLCSGNCPFDLVFMDVNMPGMSGYEATSRLKQVHKNLPVVIHTAYTTSIDQEKAFKSGCDDFLPKPLDKDKLKIIMQKYMKRDYSKQII